MTLIQRFGSVGDVRVAVCRRQEASLARRETRALNLNIHFHMLILDGVYVEGANGLRFRWVTGPTSAELTQLTRTIAQRSARFLERQGLLERDAEQTYLTAEASTEDPMASSVPAFDVSGGTVKLTVT